VSFEEVPATPPASQRLSGQRKHQIGAADQNHWYHTDPCPLRGLPSWSTLKMPVKPVVVVVRPPAAVMTAAYTHARTVQPSSRRRHQKPKGHRATEGASGEDRGCTAAAVAGERHAEGRACCRVREWHRAQIAREMRTA
jgi:hypothetical protein